MEDLKQKSAQMEIELGKLAEEMREATKRHDESNRRMEERMAALLSNQSKSSNKAAEERMLKIEQMMEQTMKMLSGKMQGDNTAESSGANAHTHNTNIPIITLTTGGEAEKGKGLMFEGEKSHFEDEYEYDTDDLRRGEVFVRRHGRRNERRETAGGNTRVNLPRLDFPKFDGSDPEIWKNNCEFYFDMYDIPEEYKTKMAVMNFDEELHEWYMGMVQGTQPLPWALLVSEVLSRFKLSNVKHPVDEFKRVHQVGKVDEYIKRFDKARLKLLKHNPILNEDFFVAGFISGLKEELRGTMELFDIKRLNNSFTHALKIESNHEIQNKKPKNLTRTVPQLTYGNKRNDVPGKKEGTMVLHNPRQWQPNPNYRNAEFQRRRALGLCDRCDEKYYPGHQCAKKVLNTIELSQEAIEEGSEDDDYIVEELEEEEVEQAVVTMFNSKDQKKVKMMKFKGNIGDTPVCALLDSGSTHSFVQPNVLQAVKPKLKQTVPMVQKW